MINKSTVMRHKDIERKYQLTPIGSNFKKEESHKDYISEVLAASFMAIIGALVAVMFFA